MYDSGYQSRVMLEHPVFELGMFRLIIYYKSQVSTSMY